MDFIFGFSIDSYAKTQNFKDVRAFSLVHQELPQILVLCFP